MNDTWMAPTMENALSIHLYRVEEVLASFRHAIVSRNIREAAFWGLELFDSDEEIALFNALGTLWFDQIGIGSWGAFKATHDMLESGELDRDELLKLIQAWCRVPFQDASAFVLLARGLTTSNTWKPQFVHSKTYTSLEDAIVDCIKRGKTIEAWLLARGLTPEEQWSTLLKTSPSAELDLLKSSRLGTDIQKRAMAFVLCALKRQLWSNEPISLKDLSSDIQSLVNEWDAENNLRKRRVYPIRMEALGLYTSRGSLPVSVSIENDLMNDFERTLWNSPYWNTVLRIYHVKQNPDGTLQWYDNCKEAFYDTYFPWAIYDTPDEWTAADRQKSHSRGLGKGKDIARKQMIAHLLRTSKVTISWTGKQSVQPDAITTVDWEAYYTNCHKDCASSLNWPLEPVRLEFDII